MKIIVKCEQDNQRSSGLRASGFPHRVADVPATYRASFKTDMCQFRMTLGRRDKVLECTRSNSLIMGQLEPLKGGLICLKDLRELRHRGVTDLCFFERQRLDRSVRQHADDSEKPFVTHSAVVHTQMADLRTWKHTS